MTAPIRGMAFFVDESTGDPLSCPLFPLTELELNMLGDLHAFDRDADVGLIVERRRIRLYARPTAAMRDALAPVLAELRTRHIDPLDTITDDSPPLGVVHAKDCPDRRNGCPVDATPCACWDHACRLGEVVR